MGMPYDEEELDAFMKHADANRDGKVDYNEVQCCFVSNLGKSPHFGCKNISCKPVIFSGLKIYKMTALTLQNVCFNTSVFWPKMSVPFWTHVRCFAPQLLQIFESGYGHRADSRG